jgi:hypothetical protein
VNDAFEKKVRAAAVAGWWVVLIGYVLLVAIWLAYLGILKSQPEWLLSMWGGGEISWAYMQIVSLWFMGAFKLVIWIVLLVALWLTLWARQLRKSAS